ncbi:MAG: YkgJ family cysteine cluster protein [Pseudomonadota bacterium]
MKRPGLTRRLTLPSGLKDLEESWPKLLQEIMAEIRSPADPEKSAEDLRRDLRFRSLVAGWENMTTAAQANAWNMIQDRLWEAAVMTRPFCLRCGECCRRGSPVLLEQDRPILAQGAIKREHLLTQRRGERAFSNREQKIVILEREQVKIKEAPGGQGCVFLSPGGDACLIYPDRPFQCRVMECWDPSRFETVQKSPSLTRLSLLGRDNPLGQIIEPHEERCALSRLVQALGPVKLDDPSTQAEALDLVLYDLHLREFVGQKLDLSPAEFDFFFGRPLALIIQGFGYAFQVDEKGRPGLAGTAEQEAKAE